jgi:hypothetical protein
LLIVSQRFAFTQGTNAGQSRLALGDRAGLQPFLRPVTRALLVPEKGAGSRSNIEESIRASHDRAPTKADSDNGGETPK